MKFTSRYKEHIVILKPGFVSNINGIETRNLGVRAEFSNHAFDTAVSAGKLGVTQTELDDMLQQHPEFSSNRMLSEDRSFCIAGGVGAAAKPDDAPLTFDCQECDFKAKDDDGLTLHKITHRRKPGRPRKVAPEAVPA